MPASDKQGPLRCWLEIKDKELTASHTPKHKKRLSDKTAFVPAFGQAKPPESMFQ